MVARLTPDQKAACSNHVGVNYFLPMNNSCFDWSPPKYFCVGKKSKLHLDPDLNLPPRCSKPKKVKW